MRVRDAGKVTWSPEMVAKLREIWGDGGGVVYDDVGAALGVPGEQVRRKARSMGLPMPWPADKMEKFRKLWAEGLSTRVIAQALEMSKNSVIGKAHRLGFPPRESPLIDWNSDELRARNNRIAEAARAGKTNAQIVAEFGVSHNTVDNVLDRAGIDRRVNKPFRPKYGTRARDKLDLIADDIGMPEAIIRPFHRQRLPPLPVPSTDIKASGGAGGFVLSKTRKCAWPFGEPGTPSYYTCDEFSRVDKSYCPTHYRVAYRTFNYAA